MMVYCIPNVANIFHWKKDAISKSQNNFKAGLQMLGNVGCWAECCVKACVMAHSAQALLHIIVCQELQRRNYLTFVCSQKNPPSRLTVCSSQRLDFSRGISCGAGRLYHLEKNENKNLQTVL